jgi:3',5'-cyclic AMP phosphodiesterase CpdA
LKAKPMTQNPVLIAQISDLHIKAPGGLAYGRVDTAVALQRCVAALNEFRPRPDLVVISGDLADTPTVEEYDYLKRLLAPLELPFVSIPGNHDLREMMRAALPQGYAFSTGALNQRVEVGGLDLVLLDSSVHGKPHGELDAPTLQWLEATWHPRATGPRCCFCTIRRSRPESGTWTGRTSPMPENSHLSSDAIHVCC